jgi:hypothetical protein
MGHGGSSPLKDLIAFAQHGGKERGSGVGSFGDSERLSLIQLNVAPGAL